MNRELLSKSVIVHDALLHCYNDRGCASCPMYDECEGDVSVMLVSTADILAEMIHFAKVKQEAQTVNGSNYPNWINANNGHLPKGSNGIDFCEAVSAYTQDKRVVPGWNNEGKWFLLNGDDDFISTHPRDYVTHWMPLPEAPKEG